MIIDLEMDDPQNKEENKFKSTIFHGENRGQWVRTYCAINGKEHIYQ